MVKELGTVVIGAGPGGYSFAIRASQLGKEVTLIEREYYGGNCLNVGCIPTKALANISETYYEATMAAQTYGFSANNAELDWEKAQDWKDNTVVSQMTNGVEQLLKKNKVDVIKGEASFVDNETIEVDGEEYTFDELVIAVGARPAEVEGFEYSDRVINSSGALNIKEVPESIVLTGGGYLGAQFAAIFGRLGSKLIVLEEGKDLVPFFEKDINRTLVSKFDEYKDAEIITEAKAFSAEDNGDSVVVTYEVDGEEKTVEADYVLVDAPNEYNTDSLNLANTDVEVNDRGKVEIDEYLRTNIDNIYAIGDASTRGGSATVAYYHGKVAASVIAGEEGAQLENKVFPSTMISSLEVGQAGLTRAQAKDQGMKVKAQKFLYTASGRAMTKNQGEGFIRLVYKKDDNTLVGAQLVGPNATESIHELSNAIEKGYKLEDIVDSMHAHPTIAEATLDAAEAALGLPIHS